MKQKKQKHWAFCFRQWARTPYAAFNSIGKEVKIGVLAVSMLAAQHQPILAQQSTDTLPMGIKMMKEVVVQEDSPDLFQPFMEPIVILTQAEIKQAAVQNLHDLFQYVQGVDLRSRGQEGVQSDLNIRGSTFDQVALLLNGINLTDPQTGHHNLDIPIDFQSIEKIEILHGPGAWSAGAVAFSGAINIITRSPEKKNLSLLLSGGSYNYQNISLRGQMSSKKWGFTGGMGHSKSTGYTQNTDFDIGQAYTQIHFTDAHAGKFHFQGGFLQKSYGANGFYSLKYPDQFEKIQTFMSSLQYEKQIAPWRFTANLYIKKKHDRFELFRNEAPEWYAGHNYHLIQISGSSSQIGYVSAWGITTFGIDWRSEQIYSNNLGYPSDTLKDPFDKKGFFNKKAFRQHFSTSLRHTIEQKKGNLSVGIMSNGNNTYGHHLYWGASLSYFLYPQWHINAWTNNAYRLPTFTDLFYQSAAQVGNPDLKPEKTWNSEINLSVNLNSWFIKSAVYTRYGYQLIDWIRLPGETIWYSQNLSDLFSYGADFTLVYRFQDRILHHIKAEYTFLHVDKKAGEYSSLYVTDYLRNQVKISLNHTLWRKLNASWMLQWNERVGTYLNSTNQTEQHFKPYILTHVKFSWNTDTFSAFLDINNLFNTSFFDFGELPQPGRWLKLGISVQIL